MSEGDQLQCSHLIQEYGVHRERPARISRITSTTINATSTIRGCGDAPGPCLALCLESLLCFCLVCKSRIPSAAMKAEEQAVHGAPVVSFRFWVQGLWRVACGDPHGRSTQLSTKSDYAKTGSGMLLMQLASGFSVGFSQKAFVMSSGQLLMGEATPCPTPGNRKK